MRGGTLLMGAVAMLLSSLVASAEQASQPAGGQRPNPCADAAEAGRDSITLPNTARALLTHQRIKVLAIGATPLSAREHAFGHYERVEKVLEAQFKGLDVNVVDRGVSGELARDGAKRLMTEVALAQPDLVFWQVGVADALALTPAAELKSTLSDAVRWLKERNVDVVLIGLKYHRSLAGNAGYQEIRQAIREVVRENGILRMGHYESMEAIDRARRMAETEATELSLNLSQSGSVCMADFLSRALAVGLFGKPKQAGASGASGAAGVPSPAGSQARPANAAGGSPAIAPERR